MELFNMTMWQTKTNYNNKTVVCTEIKLIEKLLNVYVLK